MPSEPAAKRYLFGGITALLLKSSSHFLLAKRVGAIFEKHRIIDTGTKIMFFCGVAAERYGFGKKRGSPQCKERRGGEEER